MLRQLDIDKAEFLSMKYTYPCNVERDEEYAEATGREAYTAGFPDVPGAISRLTCSPHYSSGLWKRAALASSRTSARSSGVRHSKSGACSLSVSDSISSRASPRSLTSG